jgi:hypothetical protein
MSSSVKLLQDLRRLAIPYSQIFGFLGTLNKNLNSPDKNFGLFITTTFILTSFYFPLFEKQLLFYV